MIAPLWNTSSFVSSRARYPISRSAGMKARAQSMHLPGRPEQYLDETRKPSLAKS
ncbi:MAG: hypothetical protein WA137_10355 [Methanothrix sp.]